MNPTRHSDIDKTKALLEAEKYDEAIVMLDQMLCQTPQNDMLLYIRGNAKRKKGDWAGAINDFLAAKAVNPDSPASEAADMLSGILEFRNKDLYNQRCSGC